MTKDRVLEKYGFNVDNYEAAYVYTHFYRDNSHCFYYTVREKSIARINIATSSFHKGNFYYNDGNDLEYCMGSPDNEIMGIKLTEPIHPHHTPKQSTFYLGYLLYRHKGGLFIHTNYAASYYFGFDKCNHCLLGGIS